MTKLLTAQEHRFVTEYLIDLAPERAALAAGYSASVSRSKAYQWVSDSKQNPKPHVRSAVQAAIAHRAEQTGVSSQRVLKEFARLAFLDIRKAFDEDGDLRPITDLDDDTAAAVAGLEFQEVFEHDGESRKHVGRIHKIKLTDKKGALDSLARHLGMFASDKLDLTVRKKISEMTDAELAEYAAEYERATGTVLPGDPSGTGTAKD